MTKRKELKKKADSKKKVLRKRDWGARLKLRNFLELEAEIEYFTQTLKEFEAEELIRKRRPNYIQ